MIKIRHYNEKKINHFDFTKRYGLVYDKPSRLSIGGRTLDIYFGVHVLVFFWKRYYD